MRSASPRSGRVTGAYLALGLYAYALWVVPALHAAHHARHGADHVHTDSGIVAEPSEGLAAAVHQAQHALLGDLRLEEVATAGTLSVDCSLASLTLVECAADADHAPGFADALLVHDHHAPRAPDLDHGRGSLAHATPALVVPAGLALPPPSQPLASPLPSRVESQHHLVTPRPHGSRGPPLFVA